MDYAKEKVLKYGQTVLNTKDIGKTIKQMDLASFGILTEIHMKDNGRMIKLMEGVFIFIVMELYTMAIGFKIFSMAMVFKHGKMALNISASIIRVRNKGKELTFGTMDQNIQEIG